jgi:hypothetical protein
VHQLGKWKIRKYLKNAEWQHIHQQLRKHKLSTGAEVYINDISVPLKKVKKEMSRRFPPSFWQDYALGNI